ncbi:HvfX family Cu-binding RiPP maturation protein [Alteromonas sp. a30]|uniref:HvfX family Cu-binding RiPP maturation protein n=1 Tax=Alteromonas sp. a30 TaxID=2730917 RepID=UPI00227F90BD|nr:DoxX family protein [Alteromonas sp. a30]MCY7294012.1 DoxX family protein [Alteromonas sp. a30]
MNLSEKYLPLQNLLNKTNIFDGLAPLLLRLYLAPVMIQAGWNKYSAFSDTAAWFGNPDWGLGLPMPGLLAALAIAAELVGGVLLLVGLATRWVAIPLMITMLVAAFSVHWENGWLAIADASSWLADGTILYNESIMSAPDKLNAAKSILQEHGNYNWLTSSGKFVVLNNGIEFAMTYFIMLFSLFFTGGGRFTSIDYFLSKKFLNK